MKTAQEFRAGQVAMINGAPWVIQKAEFNKPGEDALHDDCDGCVAGEGIGQGEEFDWCCRRGLGCVHDCSGR